MTCLRSDKLNVFDIITSGTAGTGTAGTAGTGTGTGTGTAGTGATTSVFSRIIIFLAAGLNKAKIDKHMPLIRLFFFFGMYTDDGAEAKTYSSSIFMLVGVKAAAAAAGAGAGCISSSSKGISSNSSSNDGIEGNLCE